MSNPSEKAMEYVRVQLGIMNHPKFTDLYEYLQEHGEVCSRRDVLGSLVFMWLKAGAHFNDGQIRDKEDLVKRIAKICEWDGDPNTWMNGLIKVRWIDKDENDGGFYIHNWMERHAREWWLKQSGYEREKALARERAARYRASLKSARDENKKLKEKMGIEYDASPPSGDHVTLKERDSRVTLRDVTSRTRDGKSDVSEAPASEFPPPESALVTPKERDSRVTLRDDTVMQENEQIQETVDAQYPVTLKERDSRVTHGTVTPKERESRFRHVRHGTYSSSSRVDIKTKDWQIANDGDSPGLVEIFCVKFQITTGQPYQDSKVGHVGAVMKRLSATYTLEEIERRINFWFQSKGDYVKGHRVGTFEKRFMELNDGPLKDFALAKRGGTNDPEDFSQFNADRDADRFKPDN